MLVESVGSSGWREDWMDGSLGVELRVDGSYREVVGVKRGSGYGRVGSSGTK